MSDFTDWQVTEWLEHKEESGGIRVMIKVLCFVVVAQVTATITLAAAFIERGG